MWFLEGSKTLRDCLRANDAQSPTMITREADRERVVGEGEAGSSKKRCKDAKMQRLLDGQVTKGATSQVVAEIGGTSDLGESRAWKRSRDEKMTTGLSCGE